MTLVERAARAGGPQTSASAQPARIGPWSRVEARGNRGLRNALVTIDALAALCGWTVAMIGAAGADWLRLATILAATSAALAAIGIQRLYRSRVAAVRAVELTRLARASTLSAGVGYFVSSVGDAPLPLERVVGGAVLTFVALAMVRSFFDAWLKMTRAQGRYLRPMLVVGGNSEGAGLVRLLRAHPELGFRIVGLVGDPVESDAWVDVPQVGDLDHVGQAVRRTGANGVVVAASALSPMQLNRATRELLDQGVHVHVSSGLHGIAPQRVRPLPLAHEPLFYLERIELAPWQLAVKRLLDVTMSSILLVLSAPVMLVAAVAIKLTDGGSVLYRQERVGREGRPFMMLKLRTMTPGADRRVAELQGGNERDGGPLFKLSDDPRRTRVGRVLEAFSLDELPQLWNVLRGDMSIVGPRPALRSEVDQFDDELLIRLSVPPGITGLWQAEARENPSFDAYRRLDIFYVENWSVALDLGIAIGTARSLIVRVLHRGHKRQASPAAVAGPAPAPARSGAPRTAS